jgi:hypothetical protein
LEFAICGDEIFEDGGLLGTTATRSVPISAASTSG